MPSTRATSSERSFADTRTPALPATPTSTARPNARAPGGRRSRLRDTADQATGGSPPNPVTGLAPPPPIPSVGRRPECWACGESRPAGTPVARHNTRDADRRATCGSRGGRRRRRRGGGSRRTCRGRRAARRPRRRSPSPPAPRPGSSTRTRRPSVTERGAVAIADVGGQRVVRGEQRPQHVERVDPVAEPGRAVRRPPDVEPHPDDDRPGGVALGEDPGQLAVADEQVVRPLQDDLDAGDLRGRRRRPPGRRAGSARPGAPARRGRGSTRAGWTRAGRPSAGRGGPCRRSGARSPGRCGPAARRRSPADRCSCCR